MSENMLPGLKKMTKRMVDEQHTFRGLCTQSDTDGHGVSSMSNWLPQEKGGLFVRPPHHLYVSEDVAEGVGRGICVHNGEMMLARGEGFYRVLGPDRVEQVGTLTDSDKQFVTFGDRLFILPDRLWYDPATKTCHSIDVTVHLDNATVRGQIVTRREGDWLTGELQIGDSVFLRCGDTSEDTSGNDGYYRIVAMSERSLTLDRAVTTEGIFDVDLIRRFPPLNYMCAVGDRLMGCGEHTVFVCEKDNPFNWYVDTGLGSAAPASMDAGGFGSFTGCICWQGYALFFKEDHIYKMMGSGAGSYLLYDMPAPGVAANAVRSLRSTGGSLYYWSPSGLQRYDGGYPQCVSRALGDYLVFPCGGGDGDFYYLCGLGMADAPRMYALHTRREEWFQMDVSWVFYDMLTWDGRVYALENDGAIRQLGNTWEQTRLENSEMELFDPLRASVTFDFAACRLPVPRKLCGVSVLADSPGMVADVETVPYLTVSVQYDGEEMWHVIGQFQGRMMHRLLDCPVLPRQCDFYRLRLETVGEWKIKRIYRLYET